MERKSLYREACTQARAYGDAMVQRMGRDFADVAAVEWNRDHWWAWSAHCALEHVQGERYWIELGSHAFASVTAETPERVRLLDGIKMLEARVRQGDLSSFAESERMRAKWAEQINRLLDV